MAKTAAMKEEVHKLVQKTSHLALGNPLTLAQNQLFPMPQKGTRLWQHSRPQWRRTWN